MLLAEPKLDEEPKEEVVACLAAGVPKLDVDPNDELAEAPKLDVDPKAGVSFLVAAPKLVVDPNKGLLASLLAVGAAGAAPKPLEEPNAGEAEILGADPRFEKDGILPPAADPNPPNPPNPLLVLDDAAAGAALLPDKRSANELSLLEVEAVPNAEKPEGGAAGAAGVAVVAAGAE